MAPGSSETEVFEGGRKRDVFGPGVKHSGENFKLLEHTKGGRGDIEQRTEVFDGEELKMFSLTQEHWNKASPFLFIM